LSYLNLSYLTLSYLTLSYLTLSYLFLVFCWFCWFRLEVILLTNIQFSHFRTGINFHRQVLFCLSLSVSLRSYMAVHFLSGFLILLILLLRVEKDSIWPAG